MLETLQKKVDLVCCCAHRIQSASDLHRSSSVVQEYALYKVCAHISVLFFIPDALAKLV